MKGKEDAAEQPKSGDKGGNDGEDGDAKNLPEKVRLAFMALLCDA